MAKKAPNQKNTGTTTGGQLPAKKGAARKSASTYTTGERESFIVKEEALLAKPVESKTFSLPNNQRSSIMVKKTTKPEWQLTAVEKMNLVRNGVSKKELELLKSKTNLDYDKLSTLLSTTRATLINKKGTEKFSISLGERIISVADVYSYGYEVFEDEAAFNEWVFRPNQALGGKPPFELLDNQFGREEVKNLVGRIEHGVYA